MAAIFVLSGCASIVSKSVYPLSINSHPSNVAIMITDKKGKEIFRGNTPVTVVLNAGSGYFSRAEYQVKFSSPGFDEKIVPVTFKIDGWYFGNIFFGGLIGMLIIDPATGAMWKLDSEFLNITLNPSIASTATGLKILDIHEIPQDWKAHLVKL
jgi:hypothetical protein